MPEFKILSRQFIFGDCGALTLEGSEGMIAAVTRVIDVYGNRLKDKGKLGHEVIRTFSGMFADPRWMKQYPGVRITKTNITCPQGKLCLN